MPTYVIVRLNYPGPEDLQHPDLIMQVDGRLPEEFLSHIKEQGHFIVPDDQVDIYTVTARYTTGRYAMTARLIEIIKAWYEEYCGYAGMQNTLLIDCSLPAIGKVTHLAPDDDAPLRRIGTLKCQQEIAVGLEIYEEAARLQEEINGLTVQLKQEVA
jgi:hypothetical protein